MGSEFLHIGDSITLYDDASDGYCGSGGIATVQMGVRKVSDPDHAKMVTMEAVFRLRQQQSAPPEPPLRAPACTRSEG